LPKNKSFLCFWSLVVKGFFVWTKLKNISILMNFRMILFTTKLALFVVYFWFGLLKEIRAFSE